MKKYEGICRKNEEIWRNVGRRRISGLPAGGKILRGRGHNSWDGPQYRKGRQLPLINKLLKLKMVEKKKRLNFIFQNFKL